MHFMKSFATFAREYGLQEASGIPVFTPAVFPVTVVDNTANLLVRTYPHFLGFGTMAATAAANSVVGIENNGSIPIVVTGLALMLTPASIIRVIYSDALDIRTANQTTSTTIIGMERGIVSNQGRILQGTNVTAFNGWVLHHDTDDVDNPFPLFGGLESPGGQGFIMRPGESVWVIAVTVNIALSVTFAWYEVQIPTPANPENLL